MMFYGCTHCFQAFTAAFCHHFCFLLCSISVWILFSVLVLFFSYFSMFFGWLPMYSFFFWNVVSDTRAHKIVENIRISFSVENSLGILFYFPIFRVVCSCLCRRFSLNTWTYADWLHRFDSADVLILLLSFKLAHFSHVTYFILYLQTHSERAPENEWLDILPHPIFSPDGDSFLLLASIQETGTEHFTHIKHVTITQQRMSVISHGRYEVSIETKI